MKHRYYDILYYDDDIIVVGKQSGVLTIPDRFDKTLPNLRALLESQFGRIYVVHRLDKETSGIMLFARNPESHKILNEKFENFEIEKIYHSVVTGWIAEDEFDIDIPLRTSPSNPNISIPSTRGKESLTKVRVIERFTIATLLECNLVTGRHHQIRAHCSAIGNPLLVDELYGTSNAFYLSRIKRRYNRKKDENEKPIINRLTLHSFSLRLEHPRTSEEKYFECSYPRDFSALINVLRKYAKG
ncbi:MAG: RluA family pseudouridine synthase [Candidatus Kapaibacteriales bacterium]